MIYIILQKIQNVKEVFVLRENIFITADEVSKTLEISKPYAYKLIKQMNEELRSKGFMTIAGKVSRRFFEQKFYGMGGEERACI